MKTVGKIILFGGIAVAAVVIGVIVALAIKNPGNVAETSETPADPALVTRHYYISKVRIETNPNIREEQKTVLIRDIEFLLTEQKTYLRSWRVVETKAEKDSAIIKAEVPVVFFTDRRGKLCARDEPTWMSRSQSVFCLPSA